MRTASLLFVVVVVAGCSKPADGSFSVRWSTPTVVQRTPAPPIDFAATIRLLDRLADDYGIRVTALEPCFPIRTTHGEINGQACRILDLDGYARLLTEEFSRYPRELVRRSRLKEIVLCTGLSFANQRRGAVPDFEHDVLYLDVNDGRHDPYHRRAVIHHEFFHLLDYRDDGLVYDDPLWKALNAAEFCYGDGGKNAQTLRDTSRLTDRYPGFLNHYGTTGVEEDKAELFALMLVRPAYVESRAKTDLILSTKVDLLKRQLALFCPDVNPTFWQASAK